MQVCVYIKKYPENFAFLILRILELSAREVCKFLKNQANFQNILLFLNVCKESFHITHVCISQKVKYVLMCNLQHIMKTKIVADFQICLNVPLKISQNSQQNTCARVYFLIKLQPSGLPTFIKKVTLAQVFLCELCEIFQNIFLYRMPLGDCF